MMTTAPEWRMDNSQKVLLTPPFEPVRLLERGIVAVIKVARSVQSTLTPQLPESSSFNFILVMRISLIRTEAVRQFAERPND
jgi:hypothetical protein